MSDDAELLRQYCEGGSQTAFRELVERHLGLVYHSALARAGGGAQLAQDASQMVFVLLAAKARTLQHHPSLAGWLHTTACFKAGELMRAEGRRKHHEQAAAFQETGPLEAAPPANPLHVRAFLDQALLALSDRDREIILQRFFESRPYAEIGRRLALAEKTVQKRAERALERVRHHLTRKGVATGTEALGAILSAQAGLAAPAGVAARVAGAAMVVTPGAVSWLTALQIMTANQAGLGVAAIFGAFAIGWAVHERSTGAQLQVQLTEARHSSDALAAQYRKWAARLEPASSPASGLGPSAAPTASKASAVASAGAAPAVRVGPAGAKRLPGQPTAAALERDPEVHEALGNLVKWNNDHYFGPMLEAAGLSSDQIQRAEGLIGQLENFGGYGPASLSASTDPVDNKTLNAELQQTLGPQGIAAYQTYLLKRQVIDNLAGTLYSSESPLAAGQASQLTDLLVASSPRVGPTGWYAPQRVNWDSVVTQASQFLTPMQLTQLRTLAVAELGAQIK